MAVLATPITSPLSAYGVARSTISGKPLSAEELRKTHAYWRACNYLMLGMIFSLAMDAIRRVSKLQKIGGHAMDKFRNEQILCRNYAYEHGSDKPDVAEWRWPYGVSKFKD